MSILRSEDMSYCHIICNEDSAWEVINSFGDSSSMHFVDPEPEKPLVNRKFYNYIKRCEEVELKLQWIRENITKFHQEVQPCKDYVELIEHFKRILKQRAENEGKKDGKTYFHEIEDEVTEQHTWLEEQLKHYENLTEQYNNYKTYRAVLLNAERIIGQNYFNNENIEGGLNQVGMNQLVGVIDSNEATRFERMIFRVTKGNCFIAIEDIDWKNDELIDPKTQTPISKKIFVIIYPAGTLDIIKNKLNRICDSFTCQKFGLPTDQQAYFNKVNEVEGQQKEAENLVEMTKNNLIEFFKNWGRQRQGAGCSKIEEYTLYCYKEKGIYHTLNLLQTQNSVYQGHAWIPTAEVDEVAQKLQQLSRQNPDIAGGQIRPDDFPKGAKPPTYFILNEFTSIFQMITNTYGVPRYKEINPALFSIMTFPFLFGVMFGDIGHGSLLFLVGLCLVLFNDKIKKTDLAAIGQARYFVMFMGLFATYCGFLYNDFMSMSLDLFGSCYDAKHPVPCPPPGVKTDQCYVYNKGAFTQEGDNLILDNCVYPFGLDPVWGISGNGIAFQNSYKMKLAVIFGVLQMSMGICFKGWNAIHFKQPLDFIFEFLPQIIFMSCTFGYMDFMIVYKWFINFQGTASQYAPSIITLLINMPLDMGKPGEEGDPYLYGNKDGSTQTTVQLILLGSAVVCIPLMLLVKPILLNAQLQREHAHANEDRPDFQQPLMENQHNTSGEYGIQNKESEQQDLGNSKEIEKQLQDDMLGKKQQDAGEEEEHGFGELFVHQVIETIEFVLGSISNTASYLRLWALSLAHSQLADVFFSNAIQPFLQSGGVGGAIGLTIGYVIFACVTFAVLMCMDVMECFLHALRLHWVEFQNKFYKADGVAFQPFSFTEIMANGGKLE